MNKLKKNLSVLTLMVSVMVATPLAACKKDNTYKVEFDTIGGVEIDSVKVEKESDYVLPTDVKKEGYIFDGWYTNPEYSGERVESIKIIDNIKLYAKWVEAHTITLDLNGGSYNGSLTITGKSGTKISDLVKDIIPTKNSAKFGNWFINDSEINDNSKLTKDITLVAKYKIKYQVSVNKESLDGTSYEEEIVDRYAYPGQKVSFDDVFEGFSYVEKQETVDEVTISESATNLLKVYFDRDEYSVTIRSNYPIETMEEDKVVYKMTYGEEKELSDVNFKCDGYYLVGYSFSPNGEVVYDAHFFENKAVNEEKTNVNDIKISTNKSTSLYAIWKKGYVDMFGGDDTIFIKDEKNAYLYRNGVYFHGEYNAKKNSFIFPNDYENLEGKIFDDGTFAYLDGERSEYSATLYKVGEGLDSTVKILFDSSNGVTYSQNINGEINNSVGTYTISEQGYFTATFTSGLLENKKLTFIVGTIKDSNASVNAFQVRDEDEVNLGKLVRFGLYNSNVSYYQAYDITLSGFGTLAFNNGNGYTTYYYTFDKDSNILTMTTSQGAVAGVCKIITVNGVNGYYLYDDSLDKEFTNDDGSKLVLDGLYNATYTNKDGAVVSGYYTSKTSVFGGNVVKFTSNGATYTFLTKTTVENVTVDGSDETNTITKYSFEVKPNGYYEYYYMDKNGIYYAPLVVLNDTTEGKATVYGYTSNKKYVKVLDGNYNYNEETKLYSFVKENYYENEASTNPIDLKNVKSFIFNVDESLTSYSVNYWYETTHNDDSTISNSVDYTSDTNAKLTLVDGVAIYKRDGAVVTGTYSTNDDNVTTIKTTNGYIYVILNEEEKTFVTLDYAPTSAYVVNENGTYSNKEYVDLDGRGNATYVYYVTENDSSVKKTITGSVYSTLETTSLGLKIYRFNSDEKVFNYIMVTSNNNTFIFPYNEDYYGNFEGKDGILQLDGFQYYASYVDTNGVEYKGMYSVLENNVVRVSFESGYRYFDLNTGSKTFTIKGIEYGTYLVRDNQGFIGIYLEFDGYNKANIFKYEKNAADEQVKVEIDDNATYIFDGSKYIITYKNNGENLSYVGYLGSYTYQNKTYNVFDIEHTESALTYINEKTWAVLVLDSKGNATKTNNKGVSEQGKYMLVTDSLLYYVNDAGTDANIYKYNKDDKTIVEASYTAKGYYTSDLKSLLFSKYGFAIFNNETRYYYDIIDNEVYIYHQDAENSKANEYGFVSEKFGQFEDVKEYNGQTYYVNDGFAITLNRKEENKDNYPVLVSEDKYAAIEKLTFTPSGADVFSVSGSVVINGTSYSCTVVKKLNELNEYETYVQVGYYRFMINVEYYGSNNSNYDVVGMFYIRECPSYSYLNTYYMYYMFLGANYAASYKNNLGVVSLVKEFNKEGKVTSDYLSVDFYDGTTAYDLNKNLLKGTKTSYEFDENTGIYTAILESTDGYKYKFYFALTLHKAFKQYGYQVYAITREEVVTSGDYKATVERIVYTETKYPVGTLFKLKLEYKEKEITSSELFTYKDVLYFVERIKDEDNNLIETNYYLLNFESDNSVTDENVLKPYTSLSIEKKKANTYYSSDKGSFVDVVDGRVTILCVDNSKYVVDESSFNEATNTYIVTTLNSKKYSITINEDSTVTITIVNEE